MITSCRVICGSHYRIFCYALNGFAVTGAHKFFSERRNAIRSEIAVSDRLNNLIVIDNYFAGDEALVVEIKAPVVLVLLKVKGIEKHRLGQQRILENQRRVVGNKNICGAECCFNFQTL